ncbi:hypothetical protein B9T36_02655 [Acinetobacter sp. ANC 4204]|uniref:Lnb N-terminal periplasmic domain-containing protein n=1 Tax=Acinetobacter sp. ANC 4204 TaxID=1977884 RepID=UPI000A32BB58|nr:DUF4105 domain-containing protein [Acinetobacter sp. ANC 4204]OTG61314.1 hypothetical protein B9T36_02655 [Acinetobacter sp. ANC 4204]
MKSLLLFSSALFSTTIFAQAPRSAEFYIEKAHQLELASNVTWQRLMYANTSGNSEVTYRPFFYSEHGQTQLKQELDANIVALFTQAAVNESIQCRFPARSKWLIRQLDIAPNQLPKASCPELDEWIGQIKPYKATLIYATDFMGNPSSMFGHTLLRLDPKDQKQLNLVSYAVNYAATVANSDSFSFAWKGLTGQYPGEYSLMPYYRKVKEYGDLESRDLWEYELALTPEETKTMVEHIWELKHVQFPYYFISDNCAYRVLGLIDLVRPDINLQQQFKTTAIPVETIKAVDDNDLIAESAYRPALETQLLAQAKQHGQSLAVAANHIVQLTPAQMPTFLNQYSLVDQARILEMAYDHLYLQLIAQKVTAEEAQPRIRELLGLRSQIDLEKQRKVVETPKVDPVKGHHARTLQLEGGKLQGDSYFQLSHRQAYHDLIDPQGGFRLGTQLKFLAGSLEYRDDRLKLQELNLLEVNAYSPLTAFKTPLSWGFNVGWQQESLERNGEFSEQDQHGVFNLSSQFGYSVADQYRKHLCYVQLQNRIQVGKALERDWRMGIGPTLGCQNIWTEHVNSLVQVELPYWEDSHQWQVRLNTQLQYVLNQQNALRIHWQYQQQKGKDWDQTGLSYIRFF